MGTFFLRHSVDALGYISVAESLGISSTTITQCTTEATEFGEITQNRGHYAVRHSRSPILVPMESSCKLGLSVSDYRPTNLSPILRRLRDNSLR